MIAKPSLGVSVVPNESAVGVGFGRRVARLLVLDDLGAAEV